MENGLIKRECVGGPLDGEIEVHPAQNFAYMYDSSWEIGYYTGNPWDGKMYWVNEPWPFKS